MNPEPSVMDFHPPTFIIFWEALSKNPVIFADLLDSCHSFIRAIVIKSAPRDHEWQRMATNDANYTNLVATKSERFH